MIPLRNEFGKVPPLIERSEIVSLLPLPYAVLEGRQEGRVWVDDPHAPRTALITSISGFHFVFGEVSNVSRILQILSEDPFEFYALFASSSAWRAALNESMTERDQRFGFHSPPGGTGGWPDWRERIPEGYALEPLDERLMEKWYEGLDPWVFGIWGGPEAFARSSFGYGLLHQGRYVSFTAGGAIGNGEVELEVGTDPDYRGRGLAMLTGSAIIERCRADGLRPAWSCHARNAASLRLAQKLGFERCETIYGFAPCVLGRSERNGSETDSDR
ncbi:MAG: GNAT family N-acetyltransferase [Armatimonadetes bacterium]|nr:GNAT family N-acetyltransferase [Armatimonadota bacterium]